MTIFCGIVWLLLCIIAIIWSIVPGIPWPQLAYVWILISQFSMDRPFSRTFIILRWIAMIALIVIDYYLPIRWTKKFWWTKRGNRWCIIGMIIWLFLWPIWLITWPFIWALIWEYIHRKVLEKCFKPAFWAFIWFLSWTILKLIASIVLLIYFCSSSYKFFSNSLHQTESDNEIIQTQNI